MDGSDSGEVMNNLPETLEELGSRIDALEKRVHELELASVVEARPDAHPAAAAVVAGPAQDAPSGEQTSSVFLLLGKSMLGIAGAYLLRALAESGVLSRLLIAAVAIAYAIAWLAAAARTTSRLRWASALYAATSALILAPMLWELTMRFRVLTPVGSAAVLGLFVVAATALSWRKAGSTDLAVAYGAAAFTALALSMVTHEMIAFLAMLLAMLAICEYRYLATARPGVRMLVAAVSDCAVWFLIVIYRSPASERVDYPVLGTVALAGPASVLLLLTATSVVFKTAALRRRITAFETVQSVIAFLLWVLSGLFLLLNFSVRIAGMVCLVLAVACYGTAYGVFRRAAAIRNFQVFAWWSAALLLAGVYLTLPAGWAIACLALAAIASAIVAVRICCTTLECHGAIYLAVAALGCGLFDYSFHALAGSIPGQVAWSVELVAGGALVCSIAARESEGEGWRLQALHLLPALLAVCAIAALVAHGALWVAAGWIHRGVVDPGFIRTLILCTMAVAAAFAGARGRRLELKRMAYALLAFIAVKLVFEDLRNGNMVFIAGSIFLFALTLIGVPRLARSGQGGRRKSTAAVST